MHKGDAKGSDRDLRISPREIKQMTYPEYIEYLLRIGAFKTSAELAADMGVTNGYVRQIKNRATGKQSERVRISDGMQRVF